MLKIQSCFALLIAITLCACNTNKQVEKALPKKQSFFHTNADKLIHPDGNEILLKGTNIGHWLVPEGYMFKLKNANSPRKIDELFHEMVGPDSLEVFWKKFTHNYIQREDISYIKASGFNHIRLPFHYKLFTQDYYMGGRNQGFVYLDRIIEWCKEENLLILLDMHCAPGGQTGDNIDDSYGYPFLLRSKLSQDLASEVWLKIANKYKDEPIIIGYDLVNEPIAHYFEDEISELNPLLFKLYKRLIADIRTVDKNHTIFVNGSIWSTNFDVFEDTLGENIVYEFHKYWFDIKQEEVQEYVNFREKHQVPIYVGETGENTDRWVAEFRELLDSNYINWCYWPYKKMNNTKGIMNFNEPEGFASIKDYDLSDRNSYKTRRENRPNPVIVQKALNQYLENCLYENNYINKGYLSALNGISSEGMTK